MDWDYGDTEVVSWDTWSVGDFWGMVQVMAATTSAPWDTDYPYRWGVALRGPANPLGPNQEAWVWAAWGRARTDLEASEEAERRARALLEALPEEWREVQDPELPF